MKITHAIIHHTAVSYDKNYEQFDAVKRYHIGKGWGDIGYHFFIEPDGTLKEGRDVGVPGAHCKEAEMNYKSLGVCLAGNFDMEKPTPRQKYTLYKLIDKYPKLIVKNHCEYATYKSCPGLYAQSLKDGQFGFNDINPDFMNEITTHTLEAAIASNSSLWWTAKANGDAKSIKLMNKLSEINNEIRNYRDNS